MLIIFYYITLYYLSSTTSEYIQKLVEHSNLPSAVPLASSASENASSKSTVGFKVCEPLNVDLPICCLVDVGLSPEVCVTVDQVHVDVLVFPISLSLFRLLCPKSSF